MPPYPLQRIPLPDIKLLHDPLGYLIENRQSSAGEQLCVFRKVIIIGQFTGVKQWTFIIINNNNNKIHVQNMSNASELRQYVID